MKPLKRSPLLQKKVLLPLGIAGALAVAAVLVLRPAVPPAGLAPLAKPALNTNHSISFPPGAPQLAYLRIEAAPELPVPLLEPLAGRVSYDENRTARIFAPTSGRVLKVLAQAGDTVKAGAPLLTLDVPDYADLRKAESDRETKRSALERSKALYELEVVARKDLEASQNDYRAAEAEVERSRARLRNLSPLAGESGFALRTPLAGIVTERQASPGVEVRPDGAAPLFVVSDPRSLWVMAELTEKDLGKLKVGQAVFIAVDAYPEQRFPGTVEAIGDVLDPQSRRVPVRCAVANPERRLKPEMFARIVPENPDRRLPKVPNTALVTEGLHTYLFVESEPGVVARREVVLAFRGHDSSFVESGLKAGERVVTAGALLLNAELAGN